METNNHQTIKIDDRLKWHFFNLYCMALSDTDFDPREAEQLYKIGLEHGLDKNMIDEIVVTSGLRPEMPKTLEEKVTYLYDLTRMAWADRKIEEEERQMLIKNTIRLGFKEENKNTIVNFLIDSVKDGKSLPQIINEIKS